LKKIISRGKTVLNMPELKRLTDEIIKKRIEGAPRLASLRSINMALSELVYAENSFTSQIAEIIRRDPSLTSRLLKLVNSVFFGLSQRVNNIEEAIFYLGLRQIRELALATPIIEDFDKLDSGFDKNSWHKLWQHSIGTGILTREILSIAGVKFEDDTDYIVGLVHNVGKIVCASVFPDEFSKIQEITCNSTEEVCKLEKDLIGWDHAAIGAYFLEKHHLGPEIVEPVRYHNTPGQAEEEGYMQTAAAVQIADHMARSVGIEGLENTEKPEEGSWTELEGWKILFEELDEEDVEVKKSALETTINRLPKVLKGMV
jgi:HD-like signal output (HDOD) protein